MAATSATVQLNTANGRGVYFIGINRRLCASVSPLTSSALFQSGYLSLTNKYDKNGNKIKTAVRSEMKALLGISPATASRNNHRFRNAGIIEKLGINTYIYKDNVTEVEEDKKWYCPTEILTESFPAENDVGNTVFITFTYSDGLVYAYYYTLLPHTGRNQRTLKVSFKEIAAELGIDESTVSDSVRKLRLAGLIYFPSGWTGVNRYKKSKVGLRRGFSWFQREKEYRALLAKKKAEQSKSGDEPQLPQTAQHMPKNDATEKQKYYSGLQAQAAQKAAQALEKALKNNDFRKLNEELAQTKSNYNRAIFHNDAAWQLELSKKIKDIEHMQASILKNIGIDATALNSDYYINCTKCNDTGAKADGTACDCWKKRPSGAPPGKGKRTTKGTE